MKALNLYPAIDLKAGKVVRLAHGDMDTATTYHEDPAAQAKQFEHAGFEWLHLVDLDGAFSGQSENAIVVRQILNSTNLKTQLGGGLRSLDAITHWLDAGLDRVILGTAAVKNPDLVVEAAQHFPGRIVVGIDAKNGEVKTDGWAGGSGHSVLDVARRFEDAGISAIVYTDIGRDGVLTGVNIEATQALATALSVPVIASGGVAGIDDIRKLTMITEFGVDGVIIGRALYDGKLNPSEALAACQSSNLEAAPTSGTSPC